MPLAPWICAHGDAPTVALPVASTVNIAPLDDSVDTNTIKLTGTGTITSFGVGPLCTKKVILKTGITLTHTVGKLELLSGANRSITGPAIGYYSCQGGDYWVETQYIPQGSNSVEAQFNNVAARLNAHDSEIYNLWTAIGNIQIGMDLRCTPIGPGVERIAIPDLPKPEGTIHSGRSSNSNDDPSTVTSCCAKQAAE